MNWLRDSFGSLAPALVVLMVIVVIVIFGAVAIMRVCSGDFTDAAAWAALAVICWRGK